MGFRSSFFSCVGRDGTAYAQTLLSFGHFPYEGNHLDAPHLRCTKVRLWRNDARHRRMMLGLAE